MPQNTNQKGGELSGALLTDEVLDSASNILDTSRGGGTKGAQQNYSPPIVARFAHSILRHGLVLDLTAGDGSLIREWPDGHRFGIEIDQDQITAASRDGREYHAIQGDVQHVAPILAEMKASRFPRLALNPPFGLKWKDPAYKGGAEVNSAELTLHYASQLLAHDGAGLIITGGDGGWDKTLKPWFDELEPEGDVYTKHRLYPYVVLDVPDLWGDTVVDNQIIFFAWHFERYGAAGPPARKEVSVAQLGDDALQATVREWMRAARRFSSYASDNNPRPFERKWKAAADEYNLRAGKRLRKRKSDYDVYALADRIRIDPRPFVRYSMARSSTLDNLLQLDKQPLTYFALNKRRWEDVLRMEEQGTLVIDPPSKPRIAKLIDDTERDIVPMTDIKPQQRLGWLEDLEQIKCIESDEEHGFVEGETYPIEVKPHKQVEIENNRAAKDKDGRPTLASFRKERWILKFRINNNVTFYEKKEDIEYLIRHFDIPNPGTVEDRYPDEVARWRGVLEKLESSQSWKFKPFQKTDLSRLLVKGSGLLAWEQGLGKTLAGLTFAKAHIDQGAPEQVLIICPQDLIPQWQREAKKFYGVELRWLRNGRDFRECNEAGGNGWYITHYEALSRAGRREEIVPLELKTRYRVKEIAGGREWRFNETIGQGEWVDVPPSKYVQTITRADECPRCGNNVRNGYDPAGTCKGLMPKPYISDGEGDDVERECGWTPYSLRNKALYNLVKNTFRNGVLIIDELTKIKSDNSLMSLAVRAVKGKYVLGMTGTPIKNYAPDAFWGLWKCLGNASARFPFDYDGGPQEFESQFSTIEWRIAANGNKQGRKRLPEVSNISKLWRLLASSVVRRRKEETGEKLVPRVFYPTLVPVGMSQRKNTEAWLRGFASYFKEKYPDHHLVEKGLVDWMAPMLGLQPKLEYSATMPEADPDKTWWEERGKAPKVSNWTPKNARVLELAMYHASKGDKVLIGSALKAPGRWFADELNKRLCTDEELEQGKFKALNILANTEDENELKTMTPAQRAKVVKEFQTGDAQVLVSSHALNLGHNLDKGSVVILTGLPWDYATFDQFIARVHRLTSERDVRVYVVLAQGTIDERKWKLLVDKASAANLALDGRLIEEQEEHINQAEIIEQMMKAGIPVRGNEVDEDELEAEWLKIKSPADLPELVLSGTPVTDLNDLKEDDDVPASEDAEQTDIDDALDIVEEDEPAAPPAPADPEVGVAAPEPAPVIVEGPCKIQWRRSTIGDELEPCWSCGQQKIEHSIIEDVEPDEPEEPVEELHPALVQHPDLREPEPVTADPYANLF